MISDGEIYGHIGEEGFARLAAAFYRQVPADDILGPMYPAEDLTGAEERLRDFLVGRFGGPQRYMERRGHPRLRMRHMPYRLDQRARNRWLQLMDRALDEAKLPKESEDLLRGFFHHMATFLLNTPG
ncbi:MAG: globin [Acidimicrobiia bacterium]|nr:globin [Acidimicrobiia bacterium]